jgi:hypothetical protein
MPRFRFAFLLYLLAIASTVLAAGRELAPRQLGESAYRQSFPAIASNGGRFLTLWREERRDFGVQIMGSLSDANGRRISPESFVVVPNANPTWMQLVPVGDGYTLFWYHSPEITHMVDLDANGRVLASRRLDVPYHIRRDIVWDGTHFLMAFRHAAAVFNKAEAVIFTRQGEIVRRGIAIDNDLYSVDAILSGGKFFVVTTSHHGLTTYRIEGDGSVESSVVVSRYAGSPYQTIHPLAIDRGDGSVLLAWSAGDTLRSELLTAVVSASGEITEPRLVAARDAKSSVIIPLLLARGTDRYVLTFMEQVVKNSVVDTVLSALTLDAAGVILDPPAEPVSIGVWMPALASNGNVTAVAYTPETYLLQRLEQRVIDARGRISEPEVHSIALSRQIQPVLGAGGGRYVAAFEEQSDKSRIRLASLDAFGEPESNRSIGDGLLPEGDLVWNGTEYLFAYYSDSAIRGVRLDAFGQPIDVTPLNIGGANAANLDIDVTWAGDKWIVVWNDPYKAWLSTISRGGDVRQRGELKLDAPLPEHFTRTLGDITIAADGTRLLVAWTERQYPPCMMPICGSGPETAFVKRFQHEGAPSTRAIQIDTGVNHLVLASSGEEYVLLTDTHAGTKVLVIDDDYAMTFLATRTFPAGLSDIIWDGEEYVMAQRYRFLWPHHLVITRFDRDLEETAPPRGIQTLRSDEHVPPSIASAIPGDAVVAIAEGDAVTGSRAVVYAERDMPLLPGPPPRRRAVH